MSSDLSDDTTYPPISEVELVPEMVDGSCRGCVYHDDVGACQLPDGPILSDFPICSDHAENNER